jgi:hypothetical protein
MTYQMGSILRKGLWNRSLAKESVSLLATRYILTIHEVWAIIKILFRHNELFQPLNDLLPMVLSAVSLSVSEQVATRFHIFPVPHPLVSIQATAERDSGIVGMTKTCAACRQQQRYCDDCQPIAVSSNVASEFW